MGNLLLRRQDEKKYVRKLQKSQISVHLSADHSVGDKGLELLPKKLISVLPHEYSLMIRVSHCLHELGPYYSVLQTCANKETRELWYQPRRTVHLTLYSAPSTGCRLKPTKITVRTRKHYVETSPYFQPLAIFSSVSFLIYMKLGYSL